MAGDEPFDKLAPSYDREFTFTVTGKAQRKIVHRYLARNVPSGSDVLEINCGTGEDALFLAGMGCRVTASDASDAMINEAIKKAADRPVSGSVKFRRLGFSDLNVLLPGPGFDLIFSDFSGLNCLSPGQLSTLSETLSKLLKPGGRLIAVVFGKKCLLENIYLLVKGRFAQLNRRNTQQPMTIGGQAMATTVWYYSVKELKLMLRKDFDLNSRRPVGLFLPPSYLDPFFKNKNGVMGILAFMETLLGRVSLLSDYGDHLLAEFRKR